MRQRLVGGNSWGYGCWFLHCFNTQSCGWRNFYPQINKFVLVNCRHRRKPTLSLFDVSTNAYWIVYKMEVWLWISKIHASTEEKTLLRKYGLSYFQQARRECKIESNVTTGRQKKVDCFCVDGIYNHCNTVFEAKGCYFHYCPCQEARPSLTDNKIMRGIK